MGFFKRLLRKRTLCRGVGRAKGTKLGLGQRTAGCHCYSKDVGRGDPRKESEKERMYIRVSLLYTRNYKSTILQFGGKKEEIPQPLSPLAPQSPAGASH